jgi:hypothetical protein
MTSCINVLAQKKLKPDFYFGGSQIVNVTQFGNDESNLSIHGGVGWKLYKNDEEWNQEWKYYLMRYFTAFIQLDRFSEDIQYQYVENEDRANYTRFILNFEYVNRINKGILKGRVFLMLKTGLSLTPYFSAINQINGKKIKSLSSL